MDVGTGGDRGIRIRREKIIIRNEQRENKVSVINDGSFLKLTRRGQICRVSSIHEQQTVESVMICFVRTDECRVGQLWPHYGCFAQDGTTPGAK